jgi:hypothetical protein
MGDIPVRVALGLRARQRTGPAPGRCNCPPGRVNITKKGHIPMLAHDVLVLSASQQVHIVSPVDVERRMRTQPITSIPAYLRRRVG